jgi:hypothetical protein
VQGLSRVLMQVWTGHSDGVVVAWSLLDPSVVRQEVSQHSLMPSSTNSVKLSNKCSVNTSVRGITQR